MQNWYNEFGIAVNAGSGHNLDLSLGISQPSIGQKRKAFEMANKERPMVILKLWNFQISFSNFWINF